MRFRPRDYDAGRLLEPVVAQHRGRSDVRIAVEPHRLLVHALCDEFQRFDRAAMVLGADGLVVRYHHRHLERAPDQAGFFDRLRDLVVFVAHVSDVETVELGERTAHFYDLLGGRARRRRVRGAGRNPDCARGERFVRHRAHFRHLGGGGGAVEPVHRRHPERSVSHKACGIDRGGMRLKLVAIGAETRKPEPLAAAVEEIERRCGGAIGRRVRETDATIAGNDRGDALTDFWRHVGVRQQHAVVVRVGVDESGSGDHPRRIDLGIRGCPLECADLRDHARAHADLALKARGARTVDDGGVADDQVEVFLGRHRSSPAQSSFAPDFFTTSAHFADSVLTKAANASGGPPTGSASMAA